MSGGDDESEIGNFTRSELECLLRAGRSCRLSPSAMLCEEGHPAARCFVIRKGIVEVVRRLDDQPQVLSTYGPGSVLALMATIDGGPCRVSLRAAKDVRAVEIGPRELFEIFKGDNRPCATLADKLTIAAIRRLRQSTDELARAVHRSVTRAAQPGRLDSDELVRIHAGNHAWKPLS